MSLRFDGMDEMREALMRLPAELAEEGVEIIQARAEEAVNEIQSTYPVWTGNLRKDVRLTMRPSPFGGVAIVRSAAPHAHLFEYGTQARHQYSRSNAYKGIMPAGNIFAPIMMRKRAQMWVGLLHLLESAGLEVRGAP